MTSSCTFSALYLVEFNKTEVQKARSGMSLSDNRKRRLSALILMRQNKNSRLQLPVDSRIFTKKSIITFDWKVNWFVNTDLMNSS